MSQIFVTTRDGTEKALPAKPGMSVMEIIRDGGVDEVLALCGGCCSCATCHVYVDPDWFERLIPMSEEEEERLDDAMLVKPNSRLSCQILMTDDLDGLRVRLAPGSEPDGFEKKVA